MIELVLFPLSSLGCLDVIVNVAVIWTDPYIISIIFRSVRMIPTEDASARKREIEEKLKQVRHRSNLRRNPVREIHSHTVVNKLSVSL